MAREYILSDIERKIGTKHNTWIWDITWVELDTLEVYMTVVDESMRNYTRSGWDHVVTGAVPYGAYTGLIRTARRDKTGLRVISADSYPQLVTPLTTQDIELLIEHQQQALAGSTQYQDLFE
jgi:hypothetical protein